MREVSGSYQQGSGQQVARLESLPPRPASQVLLAWTLPSTPCASASLLSSLFVSCSQMQCVDLEAHSLGWSYFCSWGADQPCLSRVDYISLTLSFPKL